MAKVAAERLNQMQDPELSIQQALADYRRLSFLGMPLIKAGIDAEAWKSIHKDISRPFEIPSTGRIAAKIVNHLGDEVMKVFAVN